MAELTIKRGDTFPFLRGKAEDAEGPMDLTKADKLTVIISNGKKVIEGTPEVLDPPDIDDMNWLYKWAADDTKEIGSWNVELEIVWDESSTPPEIETVPNSGYATIEIVEDLD